MVKAKFMLVIVLLLTGLLLSACGSSSNNASTNNNTDTDKETNSENQKFTLKAGHSLTEDHPYHVALLQFAEKVEERTEGNVKIEVYPLSQLGAERELTEALTLGTADMSISSTAPIANFYPEIGIVDMPFLFSSREHAYKVLDGDVGQDLLKGMENVGLVGLAWGENGFRHITNSKRDIMKPEDLEGLKLRTQENQIHLDAFEALGAKPTPMAWNEALTALQQGVVDGQENPLIVAEVYKLYEANQTHMTLTGHLYSPAVFLMSKFTWDKLPKEYQAIISEEAKKAGDFQRELIAKEDAEALGVLKEKGVNIIENVDVQPFRDAIKSVYEKYEDQFGKDKIEKILNTK